ncbi:MAG: TatD family hydrolase [Alphaproteobacteria bacterium]|nr:TatD family hydrolase [Alphaproteobacteria bacterium]
MYFDSHCHLNFPELMTRLDEIRRQMSQAGVERALLISTKVETFEQVHALAMAHDNFWCTAGVHPDEDQVIDPSLEQLLDMGKRDKVVAIGETGLDYYRLGERSLADMEWQRQRFRRHIRAARTLGLPLVIHTRAASADTLTLLKEEGEDGSSGSVGGVFHCFTETAEVARAALDLGFYISFSGIVTFKNAQDLRDLARWVPLDRMLIETDSPYLAPAPHRGKTNDPSLVPWVARQLAEIRGLDPLEMGRITFENTQRLFHRITSTT